jgi:hypothetical protein
MESVYPFQNAQGHFNEWVGSLRDSRAHNAPLFSTSYHVAGEPVTVTNKEVVDVFLKHYTEFAEFRQQLIEGAHGPYSLSKAKWEKAQEA